MNSKEIFHSAIALRAYADNQPLKSSSKVLDDIRPSDWSLIFDTETTTDAAQRLRFGVFQLRKRKTVRKRGIFFDQYTLTKEELDILTSFCLEKKLKLITVTEFIHEIFFRYVYEARALCIGFNLPFDLSRLAIGYAPARGHMRGGFSFQLSEDERLPRLQIKHLDNRAALIRFAQTAEQNRTRSMRKRGDLVPPKRRHFLDVRTLASALLSKSWSLDSLAEHLGTRSRKHKTEEHGQTLTKTYLEYAVQDVEVTWQCFKYLHKRYESFGLIDTRITRIYSEASLGKAYLRQMGIMPFLEKQPDFPPSILGAIMSSYYGGRAEVHIRCEEVQVLYCDFRSMYPTVCTLMGLWKFVIADEVEIQDATSRTIELLGNIKIDDLRKPDIWKELNILVQIQPDDDILPVRAPYNPYSDQPTIGINYLTYHKPMWFTLADCIASKLLTGRAPKVIQALRFVPQGVQQDLSPISLMGKRNYFVDPVTDDFYKRLIDLRNAVKDKMQRSTGVKKEQLDAEQLALKICANATSYGIFVELNTQAHERNQTVTCYGYEGSFISRVKTTEKPGRYFHPVLATLITGGARLMLAMTEALAEAERITWAFCDTDSMALAKPDRMDPDEFRKRAMKVQDWFTSLNPYDQKGPLLEIEDINYEMEDGNLTNNLRPLYCWAISAKRYALYNVDECDNPVIRKATANGLGHLLPPEGTNPAPRSATLANDLGLEKWEHDLWRLIVLAGRSGNHIQIPWEQMPILDRPGVSRYTATKPALLRWFAKYNVGKDYCQHVKPFNFLLVFQPKLDLLTKAHESVAPVAPYDRDFDKALEQCFDRNADTLRLIPVTELKSYQKILSQFHIHPEAKFANGKYLDSGVTVRWHVIATRVRPIGKESNLLEEQWYTGPVDDAEIDYGGSPSDITDLIETIKQAVVKFGARELAEAAHVSIGHLRRILKNQSPPFSKAITKVEAAIRILEENERQTQD